MSELFKVAEIEGKGLGLVALQDIKIGTFIVREKHVISMDAIGIRASTGLQTTYITPEFFDKLLKSYSQMSKSDREEYLKLHTRHPQDDKSTIGMGASSFFQWFPYLKKYYDVEIVKKILNVYLSNVMQCTWRNSRPIAKIFLKLSRSNHSCQPNASITWTETEEIIGLIATSNIKAGSEITRSYNWPQLSMKNLKLRQEFILSYKGTLGPNYLKIPVS